MKNLKILIVGLFAFLSLQSFGQGWERIYSAPVDTFISDDLTASKKPNGDVVIYNEGYSQTLTINSNGIPTWTPIQSITSNQLFSKDNIIAASDGNFILVDDNNIFEWGYPITNPEELHLAKLTPNLDTIWTKKYAQLFPVNTTFAVVSAKQLSDGNILVLINNIDYQADEIKIIKINYIDGSIIWTQSFSSNIGSLLQEYGGNEIIENADGTLVFFSQANIDSPTSSLAFSDPVLTKLDATGAVIWTKTYNANATFLSDEHNLAQAADGGYVFSLHTIDTFTFTSSRIVVKTDAAGNEVWRTPINQSSSSNLIVTSDNDILICGYSINSYYDTLAISKLRMDGTFLWTKEFFNLPFGTSLWQQDFQKLIEISNNEFLAIGYLRTNLDQEIYVVKIDSLGNSFTSFIQGNLYTDQNSNCALDNGELNFNASTIIKLVNGTDTSFANSDNQGNYFIGVNAGSYQIKPISSSNYWNSCPQTVIVTPNDTITQDLGLQPIIACSDLKVTITTPILRRCFSQNYYVNYSNVGTQNETATYIEIEFDPFLIVNSASIPYTQNGNIYTFQVGNLNINQTGQFSVNVTVSCNAVLGQMHCVDATIYPHQICLPNALNWSGATIIADAFCSGTDSVSFKLENIGTGNMTQARNYWVIEDQILPLQGSYQLNAGQDTIISIPANGYSYQIQAEQEITHPWGNNVPSAVTFGCNLTDSTITVNGLINQFNLDDYLNFVDVDCQQNVGAYDPNDKQGYPYGYGATNSITKDSEIEYMIRFQNTGTAPAVNVEIKDEIDLSKLDLATLEMQSSSHPYILEIEDGNTLVFKFNNIMLPDSNTNEAASHGFIRFRIAQKANNAIGTVIENSAAIYFDFNAPIVTNTTLHTVDENFVLDSLPVVVVVPTCSASFIINPMNIPNPTWQLTASSTGTAPFTYGWSFDNGNVYQSQNPSLLHNFVVGDSTYVCLTVTDATGCVSTVCQYYFPPNAPTCTASFTYTEQNGTVNFSSYSSGSSFLVYHWNFGDGRTSSAQNPMHTYTTSGTYPVCFMVSNLFGCSDTYCDTIVVSLPIANTCVADFSFQMIGTNTVQFTNLSTSNSNSSFMWDFGNGASGNAINPQYAYTTSGQYFVTLTMTDSLGCTSFASDTVSITTGTTTIEAIESIAISPNPVTDLLQVQMNIAQATNVNISIINRTGQIVNTHSEQLNNGTHRLFIPTTDLAAGMYLLHIQSENGIKTVKFVKR